MLKIVLPTFNCVKEISKNYYKVHKMFKVVLKIIMNSCETSFLPNA